MKGSEKLYKMKEADLVKEVSIGFLIVLVLVLILSFIFKSPVENPISVHQYANKYPISFDRVEMRNLLGTSQISQYGPPFNKGAPQQNLFGVSPEGILGVLTPINPKYAYVIYPLKQEAKVNKSITPLLTEYNNALPSVRHLWENNYYKALSTNAYYVNGRVETVSGNYGPIPQMISDLLTFGKSGLFARTINALSPGNNNVYSYNFENRLLFLQGSPLAKIAQKQGLLGTQWGILKEIDSYPGPWWLGFYGSLYHIPPYSTSNSGDLMAFSTFIVAFLIFIFLPFIPGLNKIPYIVPVYKIIWRRYYNEKKQL
ncbi:hypothetical protein M1145_02175 [Patescibacteria group bacterium]|nr:hypothetical protein [Patescibacteria group bacterium]